MQKQSSLKLTYKYRHYNLPPSFPAVAFLGDNWIVSNSPAGYLHFHNCIEIGYCLSGSGTIHIESLKYNYHEGDVCFIPENIAHISVSTSMQESKWEYIYFDPSQLFKGIFPDFNLQDLNNGLPYLPKLFNAKNEPYLHLLITRMFHEFHEKKVDFQVALKGLFLSFLTSVSRNMPSEFCAHHTNLQIYSALLYIHKHLPERLQIREIAALCHLSEPHFRRKFNQIMHIGPLEYINHLRIRTSCFQILDSEKPLNQIAKEVGFSSLSSFNRQFHTLIGCSPTLWRKKMYMSDELHEIHSLKDNAAKSFFEL